MLHSGSQRKWALRLAQKARAKREKAAKTAESKKPVSPATKRLTLDQQVSLFAIEQ